MTVLEAKEVIASTTERISKEHVQGEDIFYIILLLEVQEAKRVSDYLQ